MMLLRSIPHSGGNLLPLGFRESRNPAGDGCDHHARRPIALHYFIICVNIVVVKERR